MDKTFACNFSEKVKTFLNAEGLEQLTLSHKALHNSICVNDYIRCKIGNEFFIYDTLTQTWYHPEEKIPVLPAKSEYDPDFPNVKRISAKDLIQQLQNVLDKNKVVEVHGDFYDHTPQTINVEEREDHVRLNI